MTSVRRLFVLLCGEILPGESVDDAAAIAAIRRLKSIVAERTGRMILFHDPVAIQTTTLAPAFYD
jgi:hypothetical protein